MEGTYTNKGFGNGQNNKNSVVKMNGVTDLIIKNYVDKANKVHRPVVRFDGPGGFVGGSKQKPVVNVEISGIEIVGPSDDITFKQAMSDRLKGSSKFGGEELQSGLVITSTFMTCLFITARPQASESTMPIMR